MGLGGLEPPTSRLSSARSNQLSYRPEARNLEDTLAARPKTRINVLILTQTGPAQPRPLSRAPGPIARKFERETKTAKFRMSKPDWLLLF